MVVWLSWRILTILRLVSTVRNCLRGGINDGHWLRVLTHLSLVLLLHVVKSFSNLFFEHGHLLVNLFSDLSIDNGLNSFSEVWWNFIEIINLLFSINVSRLFFWGSLQEMLWLSVRLNHRLWLIRRILIPWNWLSNWHRVLIWSELLVKRS